MSAASTQPVPLASTASRAASCPSGRAPVSHSAPFQLTNPPPCSIAQKFALVPLGIPISSGAPSSRDQADQSATQPPQPPGAPGSCAIRHAPLVAPTATTSSAPAWFSATEAVVSDCAAGTPSEAHADQPPPGVSCQMWLRPLLTGQNASSRPSWLRPTARLDGPEPGRPSDHHAPPQPPLPCHWCHRPPSLPSANTSSEPSWFIVSAGCDSEQLGAPIASQSAQPFPGAVWRAA